MKKKGKRKKINQVEKKIDEEREMEEIKMIREAVVDYLSKPRIHVHRTGKMILKRYKNDGPMHKIFLSRSDMKKNTGISFCLASKNPNNWFILLNNENVGFSVPEILFWSMKADKFTNPYYHEDKPESILNFSIFNYMLRRSDIEEFFEKSSVINLLITAIKLDNNQKFIEKIKEKEDYSLYGMIFEKDVIFPINILTFLKKVITAIPVSFFSFIYSVGVDAYLERKFKSVGK